MKHFPNLAQSITAIYQAQDNCPLNETEIGIALRDATSVLRLIKIRLALYTTTVQLCHFIAVGKDGKPMKKPEYDDFLTYHKLCRTDDLRKAEEDYEAAEKRVLFADWWLDNSGEDDGQLWYTITNGNSTLDFICDGERLVRLELDDGHDGYDLPAKTIDYICGTLILEPTQSAIETLALPVTEKEIAA